MNTVTEKDANSAPVTVVATITAGEGQSEAVEAALRTAVVEVTGELGCEGYTLNADTVNPQVFMMFERGHPCRRCYATARRHRSPNWFLPSKDGPP
jgi:hypothetical protein